MLLVSREPYIIKHQKPDSLNFNKDIAIYHLCEQNDCYNRHRPAMYAFYTNV